MLEEKDVIQKKPVRGGFSYDVWTPMGCVEYNHVTYESYDGVIKFYEYVTNIRRDPMPIAIYSLDFFYYCVRNKKREKYVD